VIFHATSNDGSGIGSKDRKDAGPRSRFALGTTAAKAPDSIKPGERQSRRQTISRHTGDLMVALGIIELKKSWTIQKPSMSRRAGQHPDGNTFLLRFRGQR
jgi:hypothetical protein